MNKGTREAEHEECNPLLYRCQFLATSNRRVPEFQPEWKHFSFGGNLHILTHPALSVSHSCAGNQEIMCLGELLDSNEPHLLNDDVVTKLLKHFDTFDSLETATSAIGGRWLLFAKSGDQSRVYPDAGGLKSLFYGRDTETGNLWLGSQPSLLSAGIKAGIDIDLLGRFNSGARGDSWPGELTPFHGVRQLLPNHYLDLVSATASRFWPRGDVLKMGLDDATDLIRQTLHGLMSSAGHRKPLAMPVTGGYDSRVLLACAGDLLDSIKFFCIVDPSTSYHDRLNPRLIGKAIGVHVDMVRAGPCTEQLWRTYTDNVADMFWDRGRLQFYSFGKYAGNRLILTGGVAEVARCFYYKDGNHPEYVTPKTLARVSQFENNPIAIESFGKWLRDVPRGAGVSVLDLFYWEHRVGNWLSMGSTALDTVSDTLPPFNCRKVLEAALGVDPHYRRFPHMLFKRICEVGDSKLLEVEFNNCWADRVSDAVSKLVPWRIRAFLHATRMRLAGFKHPETL